MLLCQSMGVKICITAICGLLGCQVLAQEVMKDTLVLAGVNILSSRLRDYGTANKVVHIKQPAGVLDNQVDLSEVLSRYSGINIRSYGLNGLATASFRGASGSQTAVLWEGMNLQSPMNGNVDLSHIPISFIDDVSLQYGAGSSFFGSGSMGGAILLGSDRAVFDERPFSVTLQQQVGSFGKRYTGVNLVTSGSRYSLKVRGFIHAAENDYNFNDPSSGEAGRMTNAAIEQEGIMIEPTFRLGKSNILGIKYWYQDNRVELPTTAGQNRPRNDVQNDKFHRGVLNFQHELGKKKIRAMTGWVWHELTFNQATPSVSNSWVSELQVDHDLGQAWRLQWGVNHTHEYADVVNYGAQTPTRDQTALFLMGKKLFFEKLELSVSARETLVDGELTLFVPAIEAHYQFKRWYAFKAKAARSFRVPTFNDLYWLSGTDSGNPGLRPERGYNLEFGQVFHWGRNDDFSTELTAYSNYVEDWIQWQPGANGWSPVNVVEAWLRGIEISGMYQYRWNKKVSFNAQVNYTYTKATQEKIAEEGNQAELGKQLIYVPQHLSSANLIVNYKDFSFGLNHTFTGEQFTTADNRPRWILDAYTLTDVTMAYRKKIGNHVMDLAFRLNNAFDTHYQVRRAYPMPGRHYNLSLKYTFN